MAHWAVSLAEEPLLAQMLDPDTASRHRSADWSQRRWDENRAKVKQRASTFLAREFARTNPRDTTPETLGMAEITYPGIESFEAPATFLGSLPRSDDREALRAIWPLFLQALCDTLRGEGVITLGEVEDKEYPYGAFLVGSWASESRVFGSRVNGV